MIRRIWRAMCRHVVQCGLAGIQRSRRAAIHEETATPQINITLQGTRYSREEVRKLIDEINAAVGDGVRLAVDHPLEPSE